MQLQKNFQSIFTYDGNMHQELRKGYESVLPLHWIKPIIAVLVVIYYIPLIVYGGREGALDFFIVTLAYIFIFGGIKLVDRNRYKRMQGSSCGQLGQCWIMTIIGDLIQETDQKSGNHFEYSLEEVRKIGESKNYLILLMDSGRCIAIDKRTLTGGALEELKDHLFSACSRLKKRKVFNRRKIEIGWWIFRILFAIDMVLALAQWLV